MKKIFLVLPVLFLFAAPCSLLPAFDFGFTTNQNAGFGNLSGDNAVDYSGNFVPRMFVPIGGNGSLFMSASFTIEYNGAAKETFFIPELLLTDFSMRFGMWKLSAGRIEHSEPFGYIANGIFDGVKVAGNTKAGRFGFGGMYTGLQYKKNTIITMTNEDFELYNSNFDFSNFKDTYFAPNRLLFSFDWDHPSVAGVLRLRSAITGQVDLTKAEQKIHSEYATLKIGVPVKSFLIEAGGNLALIQAESFNTDFAAEVGISWMHSGKKSADFYSVLTLSGVYAGGNFIPVTTSYIGELYREKLTGHAAIELSYAMRLTRKVGANMNVSYFIDTDAEEGEGSMLGAEIYGAFIWDTVSDLQFVLGGGAFLPKLGNAKEDESAKWKVDMTMVLSLF